MKQTALLLFALLLITACSKDQTNDNLTGDYSITGKFLTPNGKDAVSKATVNLFRDGNLVKEGLTDSEGNFVLSDLPKDNYQVNSKSVSKCRPCKYVS